MNPPKMPIHIGDYQRDTGHLRAVGHGAYLLLMFHYWSTGGLPDDDDQLAAIARMTKGEWRKHKPVLQRFFKEGWKHGRIDFELEKAANISQAAREAGLASGRTRSQRKTNGRSTVVEPTLEPSNHLKKDAADAAPQVDPEKDLFRRGKEIAGNDAGGLIAKLLKSKKNNVALARAAIETAATKQNPREYIGAVIAGGHASADGKRLTNDEQFFGVGRLPGVV